MEILNWLPIESKLAFINLVKDNSFTEENNIRKYSNVLKEVFFDFALIQFYTDYLADKNEEVKIFEVYNECQQNGTIAEIRTSIPSSELDFLEYNLDDAIQVEIEQEKSFALILGKFLNKFLSEFDEKKIKKLVKEFQKISPQNMEIIKKIYEGEKKNIGVK